MTADDKAPLQLGSDIVENFADGGHKMFSYAGFRGSTPEASDVSEFSNVFDFELRSKFLSNVGMLVS